MVAKANISMTLSRDGSIMICSIVVSRTETSATFSPSVEHQITRVRVTALSQ